jgi:hypothetical protein
MTLYLSESVSSEYWNLKRHLLSVLWIFSLFLKNASVKGCLNLDFKVISDDASPLSEFSVYLDPGTGILFSKSTNWMMIVKTGWINTSS